MIEDFLLYSAYAPPVAITLGFALIAGFIAVLHVSRARAERVREVPAPAPEVPDIFPRGLLEHDDTGASSNYYARQRARLAREVEQKILDEYANSIALEPQVRMIHSTEPVPAYRYTYMASAGPCMEPVSITTRGHWQRYAE